MKAFRIERPGEYAYTEIPKPEIKEGEVLVKPARMGFCGSDLNTWKGLNPMVTYPRIVGHEISGVIEEIGENIPNDLKIGMQVTVNPYTSCGTCASCQSGRKNACQFNQTLGVQRDGASCEYIVAPWEKIIVSNKLSLDELVLVEPLSVGFHAVKRGRIQKNDTVAVFGCGMIGLGAILGASVITDKVIAIDIADDKFTLAKKLGASHTINPLKQNLHDRFLELTGGKGPNVMIEVVGSPVTYKQAVEEVAFAGRVVYIGYAKNEVSYATKLFVMKEMDILGSRNADEEDFENVLKILETGKYNPNDLITWKVSFENAGEAMKDWAADPSKVIKLVVDFDL